MAKKWGIVLLDNAKNSVENGKRRQNYRPKKPCGVRLRA